MTPLLLLRGFRARLILGAIVWIAMGTAVGGYTLIGLFRDRVQYEFESELDHHATELAAIITIRPDGRAAITQPLSDHRFSEPTSGYYWQVQTSGTTPLRSASLGDRTLTPSTPSRSGTESYRIVVTDSAGPIMQTERVATAPPDGRTVQILVAIDVREIDDVMNGLQLTIIVSLATIALGLIAAAVAQVTFGLRPLSRVRQALRAISLGHARRLPDDLPPEVAPLAQGMNEVLAANEKVVQRARIQAGNLAHALKTPLAVLIDEAERMEARGQPGEIILQQCERMRRQIEHHLARARAAASSASVASATPLSPAIAALISAIASLHRDRGLRFDQPVVDIGLVVLCEAEDLDEMLGNLLDNAAKWAHSTVAVRVATPTPGWVRITVEDDGPGMPDDAPEIVFRVGERMDEAMPGSGLGLAIVRDVAEAYGGSARLDHSMLGGAAVSLELPIGNRRAGDG